MSRLCRLVLAVGVSMGTSCDRAKPPAQDDVPTLRQKLNDGDAAVRQRAATALAQSPAMAKASIPGLVRALYDENADVRYAAASSLRVLRATDRETTQALVLRLKDPVGKVRAAAAKALRDAALSSAELLPVLVESLADENEEVRRYTSEAFLAKPAEAEPVLLAALDRAGDAVRTAAAGVLFHNLRDPVAGMIQGLQHPNPRFRVAAATALRSMGSEASVAVGALTTALKDDVLEVRLEAIYALGEVGPGVKLAADALKASAQDERLRAAAELALHRMQTSDGVGNGPVERVAVGNRFRKLEGIRCPLPGSWPAFRGPDRNNISTEDVTLANHWRSDGPPVLWKVPLGWGYAGAAVADGRVFVSDYDINAKEEALRCFSLDDGQEIWRRGHQVKIVNNHGFSRCVPAVSGKQVVSIGPLCHVMCLDTETGELKWGIDLRRDYGTRVPFWYTGQCPLIDDGTVVLAPCGTTDLMIGVDRETGRVIWRTPNTAKLEMSHTSVVSMTLKGKRMYIYAGQWGRVVGVSADPEDRGRLLWETTVFDKQVFIPSPLVLEDGLIYVTGPYQAGSAVLRILSEGPIPTVQTLWRLETKDGLSSEQQTPIYYNKHIFGLAPDSSGVLKQQFLCIDPFDQGKVKWSSGKEKRFGQYEPYLLADGKFLLLDKSGYLVLVKASIDKYEELARAKVYEGNEAWAPMALVGGRLILRDSRQMICLNLAD